jgi:hypothetical protein
MFLSQSNATMITARGNAGIVPQKKSPQQTEQCQCAAALSAVAAAGTLEFELKAEHNPAMA